MMLLEIRIPRDVDKSPLATEVAITSLLQSGGLAGWFNRNITGKLPVYSSLEIASIEGTIHFYVRAERRFRNLIESSFYSQYPGIEIVEADDYTKKIRYDHLTKDVDLWGSTYGLTSKWEPTNEETGKPFPSKKDKKKNAQMPADFLPIKTYVELGLDKDPKDEHKVDQLSHLLEAMATCGKGEHFWFQVLVQDESVYNDTKMPKFYVMPNHKHLNLREMADARTRQLRSAGWRIKGEVVQGEFGEIKEIPSGERDKDGRPIMVPAKHLETKPIAKREVDLTQEQRDEIEEINRKLNKPLALAVIRITYIAKKENFNPEHIQHIMTLYKLYNGKENGLGIRTLVDPYDYPWERIRRIPWRKEEHFEAYVEREGFFPHFADRKWLDIWSDNMFWLSSMRTRKIFRMLYESILHPFEHPHPVDVVTLNLEEIATLWHIPSQVTGTPLLPRIDSTKGMAPSNLPIK
jgi:hypothetical protein